MTERLSSPERKIDYRIVLITLAVTIGHLAISTHRSSRVYLYQQSLCFTYYRHHEPATVEGPSQVDESLCKIPNIQSPLSIVEGFDVLFQLIPGIDQPSPLSTVTRYSENLLFVCSRIFALLSYIMLLHYIF